MGWVVLMIDGENLNQNLSNSIMNDSQKSIVEKHISNAGISNINYRRDGDVVSIMIKSMCPEFSIMFSRLIVKDVVGMINNRDEDSPASFSGLDILLEKKYKQHFVGQEFIVRDRYFVVWVLKGMEEWMIDCFKDIIPNVYKNLSDHASQLLFKDLL